MTFSQKNFVIRALLLILLVQNGLSCSKDSKKSNSVNSSSPTNNSTAVPTTTTTTTPSVPNTGNYTGNSTSGYTPAGIPLQDYEGLKNKFVCTTGKRLSNDVLYNISAQGSQTTLYGAFQAGSITAGESSKTFIGVSQFNDLMFVTKIIRSGQVVGYNVTISYCYAPVEQYYCREKIPYIDDSRQLTNFAAPYGLTLVENTNCAWGLVDAARDTLMTTGQFSGTCNNMQTSWGVSSFQTSFYAPSCTSGNY